MFRQFLSDERGTVTAETVIMIPLLLWTYLALYIFWDAYRSVNRLQKASYTIADLISREKAVTPAYLTGLGNIANYLAGGSGSPDLRVTSVVWSAADTKYKVEWSRAPKGGWLPLTTQTLQTFVPRIPVMSDGDTVIVVETRVDYQPPFDFLVGVFDVRLAGMKLDEFIPTSPRFGFRVCLEGVTCVPST